MTAPLHPRGTLRTRFQSTAATDVFRKLGVGAQSCDLGDEGLYLAEELVAADAAWLGTSGRAEQPEALAILVLALMIAQDQGSTRLPLDASKHGPLRQLVGDIVRVAGLDTDVARVLKTIVNLTGAPRFNSVIGVGGARLPLVVDDGCLYTERSRWLEHRVARRLGERIAAPARDPGRVAAALADLRARPAGARALSDEQTRAVELALGRQLAIITGGPGTGKTLVAASVVRGLARLQMPNVALAAQTGKAANRLTQVIGEQLAAIGDPSDDDRGLQAQPPAAQTLHRLLGYRAGRFAHHALSPLPYDAVLVDEASMIDLELVDALLDALPAQAPLILVGDAHQLPAIDAGQILADLAAPDGPAPQSVAVLARSYRMDTSDVHGRAVYVAAQAIHEGNAHRLCERTPRPATRASTRPHAPSDEPAFTPPWPIEESASFEDPRAGLAWPTTGDGDPRADVDGLRLDEAPEPDPTSAPAGDDDPRAGLVWPPVGDAPSRSARAPHESAQRPSQPLLPLALPPAAPPPRTTRARSTTPPPSSAAPPLATVRTPGTLRFRGVEWVDTLSAKTPHDVTLGVAEATWHHFDGPRALRMGDRVFRFDDGVVVPEQRAELEQLWSLLQRARILTVTRALPTGSIAVNAHLHELALDRLSVEGHPDFVPGEPVMVTANDYQRGLFNGDQGIVIRADEGIGRHHYRAVFRCNGELRPFAIEALRDRLELAWALTVHKSQGSELDAIALLLPHDDIPLLTRELLYTGVTRARTSVVIAGARPILTAGGRRRALRHSGLGSRLRATLRP